MLKELVRATRQAVEQRMSLSDFDSILDMLANGGAPSYTGKLVSPKNAMGIAAVWACITTRADDFAALPLRPMRWKKLGVSHEQARAHYLWKLFMEQANPRMSSFDFKQAMEVWRLLWGNCYAEMEENGRGQIVNLWPWRPDRVKIVLENPADPLTNVWYVYLPMDHSIKPIVRSADQMLHIKGVSLDGYVGLSPIEVHRQTMGLAMAQQESAGRFYGNGMIAKGVLTHPGQLSTKALNSLKESMANNTGLENAHRLLILEEGLKYEDVGMKMEDAQWIESNKLTGQDVARIYKMPAHKIGFMDAASHNNIEQLSIDYVAGVQIPVSANWSGRVELSMLGERDKGVVFMEPDFSKLMMADSSARAAFYNAMRWVLSPDDIRMREGYNPLPDGLGELPRVPLNTAPMDSAAAASGRQGPGKPKDKENMK